jgi:N-acetylmuramoyl-L-alanine amidase
MLRVLLIFAFGVILSGLAKAADEKPLEGAIIVIDPGHGGQSYSKSYTGGTRGTKSKLTESELNLRVALELKPLLEQAGAKVLLT